MTHTRGLWPEAGVSPNELDLEQHGTLYPDAFPLDDLNMLVSSLIFDVEDKERRGEIDHAAFLALAGVEAAIARKETPPKSFAVGAAQRGSVRAALLAGDEERALGYVEEFGLYESTVNELREQVEERLHQAEFNAIGRDQIDAKPS